MSSLFSRRYTYNVIMDEAGSVDHFTDDCHLLLLLADDVTV
jgi:hypothetical protein